jgi:hypothetical protein
MEFFENGVTLHGTTFFPWDLIDLRKSKYFVDRIVVVIRTGKGSVEADTQVVQVCNGLRGRISARHGVPL